MSSSTINMNLEETENKDKQTEELMALEAIFPEAFEINKSSDNAFTYTLNLDEDDDQLRSPRKLVIHFYLPPTYPSQDMPIYEISSVYCGNRKMDEFMLDEIDEGFKTLFRPTEVVLFEWISWLREYLEENVPPTVDYTEDAPKYETPKMELEEEESDAVDTPKEDDGNDRPTVRALLRTHNTVDETCPEIFSTEPLMDRKSTFIAHVARVTNVHEVKTVVGQLLSNKKIAKATHNILAYRIVMADGKILQDNDDDGETAAGSRLLHLMQILEVENVVLIVSRWFGGIHLGPDRFKDINNIGRTALENYGFIKDEKPKSKHNTKHNTSKHKKHPKK
ncbi:ribosomal protein S5 domain 2-type protein [Pilobolus umbonatus]|nr:ribosomal protein S5 domain 2-type protein [Pilobolus umbonatus]